MKPLVIIESPFAGDVEANITYARKCVADSLARQEAPICSHLLFPQLLNDDIPGERALGIEAGLAWYRVADKCVVYMDKGISDGMREGMKRAVGCGVRIEVRGIDSEVNHEELARAAGWFPDHDGDGVRSGNHENWAEHWEGACKQDGLVAS